jgi:hypothetical protein
MQHVRRVQQPELPQKLEHLLFLRVIYDTQPSILECSRHQALRRSYPLASQMIP